MATLKPFVINLNDLAYLLAQVNFQPLFDLDGNAVVDWDGQSAVYDGRGELYDLTGLSQQEAWDAYGHGFPHVSSPIGVRDVTGFHNNLFGTQADWGAVDVPFRRDIAADFDNYVTSPGANYGTTVDEFGAITQSSVIDYMPRIISRTITTAGVNLLRDGPGNTGHFVEWDAALYESGTTAGLAYQALIDGSGVDTSKNPDGSYVTLVDGAKIVAPLATEIVVLDNQGNPLIWHLADYTASTVYTTTLAVYASLSQGGELYGSELGDVLVDGGPVYYQPVPGTFVLINGMTYQPDLLAYKQLVDGSGLAPADLVEGGQLVTTAAEGGYGLLETLGHIDFQNPGSGEYFIGSENPGVAPVNSWFGIFGQFFDHGLDLIGKGGQGTKITIALEPGDPLYGTQGPDGQPVTSITVSRATIAGADANGDPTYVNHTSPFIDQSQTYGSVDQITQLLRKWETTDGGATFHAGMELFDGATLVDTWTRRWPDGTTSEVHDTLPTLSELRDHVLDTGRAALTWDDVADYRNRDADGQLSTGNSGHALILDMNPRFDSAHLDSAQAVGGSTVDALVDAAVATLNASLAGSGMSFGRSGGGSIELVVTGGAGAPMLPDGTYTGATALAPWINFADFSIMNPPPGPVGAEEVKAAVSEILMAAVGDHYIAGDGRVNENFGLTSIHHVFHEEHNYQVANLKTWIYAHDTNNHGVGDLHEQLHNWQIDTGVMDAAGNYTYGVGGAVAWDADKMFEATKLVVEMEYQHAAVDQYARTITPRIQEFVGYSTGVDATISLEYAQVAFRFGHSTIRETIDTVDPNGWMLGNVTRYALEKAFLTPQTFAEEGVAAITLGLSRQQMNEVDEFITPALTQGLLDQPLDLPAINIARGRDLGIPTLNDFRAAISLAEYTSWADFGANMFHAESLVNFIAAYSFSDPTGVEDISVSQAKAQYVLDIANGAPVGANPFADAVTVADAIAFLNNNPVSGNAELEAARGGFDHIDSWIGGLAEAHVPGGLLGETFDAVFVAQIQSLMDGDRFYYLYRLFGTQIHEEVNNGQFKDIVERNTGLEHLNGSIFAYADQYYDFNRGADGTLTDTNGNHGNHLYADLINAPGNTRGVYSDGGASTDQNGTTFVVDGVAYIRDIRPELDPTLVHPLEGTPTSGADSHEVIVGTAFVDFIHGRAGDDTLYGEGGDDILFGDGGIDRLYGGDGNDFIDSGEGPDLADGGAGKDTIYGRGSGSEVGGFDQLVGGSGNDLVIGGEGIDKLSGGSGDDIIYGDGLTNPEMGNTDAFTHAGDGNDYIDTGASGDLLYGEEGDDYMVGGIDQDLMQGGVGDDILRPGTPSQAINGGPDEVVGDDGFTNSGFDLMDLSDYAAGAPGVVADMVTQFNPLVAIDGNTPFPTWFQIEGVIGTQNDDTFIGTDAINPAEVANPFGGSNWLIGGSGSDTFTGKGGNDLIVGGSIRLDSLIGTYEDAANATGLGNLALGSTEWIADAMRSGSVGYDVSNGPDGYDNDDENAYTGASNQATGQLQTNGLIDAVNAIGGGQLEKHFTDMLKSRMFKDVVLGDDGTDGTADRVVFSGNRSDYTIARIVFTDAHGTEFTAYKIAHTLNNTGVDANGVALPDDGTDIVVGVDQFAFADGVISVADLRVDVSVPVDTDGNEDAMAENVAIGTAIGITAFAEELDTTANPVSYSLSSNPGGLFAIDAVTGVVTTAAAIDYEAFGTSVDIEVTATSDDGSTAVQTFTIAITDVNEAPGSITLSAASVVEHTLGVVGTLAALGDPDAGDTQSFAIVGGDTRFAIVGDQLVVASTTALDLERDGGATTVTIRATDQGGLFVDQTFAITIADMAPDIVNGTAGNDVIFGGVTNDMLFGGFGGHDQLFGGEGNDAFRTWSGNDTYDGGEGSDSLDFAAWYSAITIDLGLAGPQALAGGSVTVTSIENVTGGRNHDRITGNDSDNFLAGGAGGNDIISGGLGNDTFRAWSGLDTFDGGEGSDTVSFAGWASAVTVDLSLAGSQSMSGGAVRLNSIENVIGGNNMDRLIGSSVANVLEGGGRRDVLTGGAGDDTFVFRSTSDSGVGVGARDIITDFAAGDRIDVSAMLAGDFALLAGDNAAFTGAGGELRWFTDLANNRTIVEGTLDADTTPDFQVQLTGIHTLNQSSFLL